MLDVLIIGGGVSGVSCALLLGSAHSKPFVTDKKIGIFTHQKNSSLQEAIFYNAYGVTPGKLGSELLTESTQDLATTYPHITQIPNEKVMKIEGSYPEFIVVTNKNSYKTKNIVVGIGSANTFDIEGLMQYVEPHKKALPEKQRIQLKNEDHKVADAFGVWGEKKFMGKVYDGLHRISFLIAQDGKVEKVFDNFKTKDHHQVVLDYLS